MYIYTHIRPGDGYEPGDVVTEEYAQGHPYAVTEIPDKPPVSREKAAQSEEVEDHAE